MNASAAQYAFKSLQDELGHLDQLSTLLNDQASALFGLDANELQHINQQQEILVEKLALLKSKRLSYTEGHSDVDSLDELLNFIPTQLQSKANSLLSNYRSAVTKCYQLNKNNQTLCQQHGQVLKFIYNPDQLYGDQTLMLD